MGQLKRFIKILYYKAKNGGDICTQLDHHAPWSKSTLKQTFLLKKSLTTIGRQNWALQSETHVLLALRELKGFVKVVADQLVIYPLNSTMEFRYALKPKRSKVKTGLEKMTPSMQLLPFELLPERVCLVSPLCQSFLLDMNQLFYLVKIIVDSLHKALPVSFHKALPVSLEYDLVLVLIKLGEFEDSVFNKLNRFRCYLLFFLMRN